MTLFPGRTTRRRGAASPAPGITGLSTGPLSTAGGTSLTLTGTNYLPGAQVEIDGTLYAATYNSSTSLTVITPAHAAGNVNVRVKNPDAQFSNTGLVTYASPFVDPATLTPAVYLEQRNDASDYTLANGIWAKRAGAGNNWTQATSGNRPVLGTAVNGCFPFSPHADNTHQLDTVDSRGPANGSGGVALGSATQFAFSVLLYIPSGLAYVANANSSPSIFGDAINQQYWTFAIGDISGSTYAGIFTNDGSVKDAKCVVTPNAWNQISVRHDAGLLSIGCNVDPPGSGAQTVACGTMTNPQFAITTHSTAVAAPGAFMLSFFAKLTMTAADFTTIRSWWRGSQYPSLAGVLPP